MELKNPRKIAREAIRQSVPAAAWEENGRFCDGLRQSIERHRIMRHPIIVQLEQAEHGLEAQRYFHLEFRHAFAQIFTDALIQAMVLTSSVEPLTGAMGKVASRFLLQLNLLDELGFVPARGDDSEFSGNPQLSHYVQFDGILRQLGMAPADVDAFQPSRAARACRATFESHYADFQALIAVMATSETVFSKFSGPWAQSVAAKTNIDVSEGYHSIHVGHDGEFIDDDHSEDAWFVVRQAAEPARFAELSTIVSGSLDTWTSFLDSLAGAAQPASALT